MLDVGYFDLFLYFFQKFEYKGQQVLWAPKTPRVAKGTTATSDLVDGGLADTISHQQSGALWAHWQPLAAIGGLWQPLSGGFFTKRI